MDASELVQHVTQGGDEAAAIAALTADASLARARNAQGVSIVCLALYRGFNRLAAALAARRDDLDVFEASCLGDLPRVTRVLADSPDAHASASPDGFSPLGYSAFFGHLELLVELLRRGAAVNEPSRNAMRVCPLHSAAAHSDAARGVALARALLDAGADPNLQQQAGYTALHEAALHAKHELLELLLECGAEPNRANDRGERPIDLARARDHTAVIARLERAAK
jgi:uncharacterized protein